MSGIKIDPRFKGEWHYEQYLLIKHKKEIMHYCFEMNYPRKLKLLIEQLYDQNVDKENIIQVYTHPPSVFVNHLCYGRLHLLYRYTSIHSLD
jgi:hypothetical protein